MKVVILHNKINKHASPDDLDTLDQVRSVKRVLLALGYRVKTIECDLNLEKLQRKLTKIDPDLVFNLIESLDGKMEYLNIVPILLATHKIPFTGSGAYALYVTTNKDLAKQKFHMFGLPTASWVTHACKDVSLEPGEYIIKPIWQDASVGITDDSIFMCHSMIDVLKAIRSCEAELSCECFAEKYIDGREFNVSLLELGGVVTVFPIAEMMFDDFENKRKILTYNAKWLEDSFDSQQTRRSFECNVQDSILIEQLKAISLNCWDDFNLKGYARIDFRVDQKGQPYILEINANPCIAENSGFVAAGAEASFTYHELIDAICQAALK